MQCENDKIQITNWLNNEMTDAERLVFEIHLAGCSECLAELQSLQKVWNMAGQLPAHDLPGHDCANDKEA